MVQTLDNASNENELPVRWLETSEETSTFWLVWGDSFIGGIQLVGIGASARSSRELKRKHALIEPAVLTRPNVQLQTVLGNLSWSMSIRWLWWVVKELFSGAYQVYWYKPTSPGCTLNRGYVSTSYSDYPNWWLVFSLMSMIQYEAVLTDVIDRLLNIPMGNLRCERTAAAHDGATTGPSSLSEWEKWCLSVMIEVSSSDS